MSNYFNLRSWCLMAILCILTALSACQSVPSVQILTDKTADFSRYTTFAFHPQLILADDESDKLSTRYIKAAIINEMQKKGFRYGDAPELWVNFHTYLKDKINVTTVPHASFYYGYRRGYGVWADYPFYDSRVDQYTEGTLNIDLIDRQKNQLLWEGIAVGRLSKKTLDNLETKVNEAVALIFEKFP